MNLKDSIGNELSVGDKVAVSLMAFTSGGNGSSHRRVKFGNVVSTNKKTINVAIRGTRNLRILKPRSILKVASFSVPTRGRKVLAPLGTNIVEMRIVNTTATAYNLKHNGMHFQHRKHMVIKV